MLFLLANWLYLTLGANYFILNFEDKTVPQIPHTYDARLAFPHCADIIGNIRDQASCGSCWAVSVAGAISDRICIQSGGTVKVNVSGIHLTSCENHSGWFIPSIASSTLCTGGSMVYAWLHAVHKGVVSDWCSPYPFQQCLHHHHANNSTLTECSKLFPKTPKCPTNCQDGRNISEDKYYMDTFEIYKNASDEVIQAQIMDYGPVTAGFILYKDFFKYRSGVYIRSRGPNNPIVYGHVVRIIGWGDDNGVPYWLIANSYNTNWGEKGYGKMWRNMSDVSLGTYVAFADWKKTKTGSISN